MQLVYFLFLPFALLSVQLLGFATSSNGPTESADLALVWQTLFNMWFIVGCFGLAARWMDNAQRQCFDSLAASSYRVIWLSPFWMFRNRESLLLWFWCLLQPVFLVASGWTRFSLQVATMSGSQAIHMAIMLVPTAALLLLIEIIGCSKTNRHRYAGYSLAQRIVFFSKDIKSVVANTWLFPLVLPICIACIVDVGALVHIVEPSESWLGASICTIVLFAIVSILLPHVFSRLIGAGPIDEAVALAVECTWRKGSVKVPRILHWPTGCRMANAAVVGLFSHGRKLLLTDALLQKLSQEELSMVVLHELAHCVRFHAWIRLLPTLLAIAMLFGALTFLSGIWLSLGCVITLVLFLAGLIAICWWTEFDADRNAIEFAIGAGKDADRERLKQDHSSELCEALAKIYGLRNRNRSSWMHPSCEQRIAAIKLFSGA